MRDSLKEERARVQELLGIANDERVPPKAIDRELNRARHQIALQHQVVISEWTATSVASKILYVLPKRLLRLGRVYFDDKRISFDAELNLENMEDQEDPQPVTWVENV